MRWLIPAGLVLGLLLLIPGCPPEDYATLVPATLSEIDRIRNDPNMPPQEMRSRLAELGLDPTTINAVLAGQTLANQDGGSLRTAYDKLTAPDFTALTPDELQILATRETQVDTTLGLSLTDAQAQALANMLRDHDLLSSADVVAFLDQPGNNVPSVITDGEQTVRSMLVDFDFSRLLPLLP
jgi:hypothetical protein